jgi:carboxypeptidase C (cathepsin A)
MEWLKSQLASWKVKVALAGGALVVATAYGTCTFDPETVSDNTTEANGETITETTVNETVEVSATTTSETSTGGESTETTTETTTETE